MICRSVREGKRVRHETIANVSKLPPMALDALRRALAGQTLVCAEAAFGVERSLPHGHVAAVLAACRRLELGRLIDRAPSRERSLVVAMICQRVLAPGSKLACARALARSTLADELGVAGADEDELYGTLDWLAERQGGIEARLARRHLKAGELALYDLSSSYFEGRTCSLAALGYSRDGRRGTLQIVYGLVTDRAGRPVCVEVFDGATHDHQTVRAQLDKLKGRLGLSQVVLVADRGMVTKANLDAIRDADGIAWITALKAPQIKRLARAGAVQPSLFDEHNLAEIESDEFPDERLVVCRNPLVAAERARKREALLGATEADLEPIRARVAAGLLTDAAQIGLAVGEVIKRHRVKSTSPWRSQTGAWPTSARPTRSPRRPRWTASTCCAPASPPSASTLPTSCAPTSSSKKSSATSASSRARSFRSARSTTAATTASARTCSCACSPSTSSGTCARPGAS
ncbi:MAG TPA: IS1634 family transposase [Albitalea sp.]|nr:IS1634 family transposase [Albitalea sp.]